MSAGQLVQRILAAESEIWLEKIARGKLEEHEMKQLYAKRHSAFGTGTDLY